MATGSLLLTDVRLTSADAEIVDVLVLDGHIARIGRQIRVDEDVPREDGHNDLLLPGLIDAHAHVDKTLWGGPWVPHSAGPTLRERTANERRRRVDLGLPRREYTAALLAHMVTMGTTRVRTHTVVDPHVGLTALEIVREAARTLTGSIDVQQVAFPQGGVLSEPGTLELLEEAVASGAADLLGAIDPAGVDNDPVGQLDALFEVAARHGVGIDIHLHDGGSLGAREIGLLIERAMAFGMQGRVAISHGFALGEVNRGEQERLARGLSEAGISVITSAVYSAPIPPLALLRDAGVNVAAGNDGVRDLWGPYGSGDMLERAMHLAYRSGFRRDDEISLALDAATYGAARALGVLRYGLGIGDTADLVLVNARTAAEAVVVHPVRRLVTKSGRVVARDGRLVTE